MLIVCLPQLTPQVALAGPPRANPWDQRVGDTPPERWVATMAILSSILWRSCVAELTALNQPLQGELPASTSLQASGSDAQPQCLSSDNPRYW
ncbi:MAG: hypothetical protein ACK53Y_19575, partial [bacterium]